MMMVFCNHCFICLSKSASFGSAIMKVGMLAVRPLQKMKDSAIHAVATIVFLAPAEAHRPRFRTLLEI
jgi:hypothetical protein